MSRIGKQPVPIPSGVTVTVEGCEVRTKGPKGELRRTFDPRQVSVTVSADEVRVASLHPEAKAYHGTVRKLVANMVRGVHEGFAKRLEINGVGYKAQKQGGKLVLTIGFSHPVEVPIPEGIEVDIEEGTKLTVRGCDNIRVGDFAARLRGIRPPEPYLGKGIKYADEVIRRKVGKTGA